MLQTAYQHCGQTMRHHSRSYYLGTLAMPPAKRRAIWAVYTWCRTVDDLVDEGKSASQVAAQLDRAATELESTFCGQPQQLADIALADTAERFALEITPFQDMLKGQRMDLEKNRYATFAELELYCYRVAGTVGLMSVQILNETPVYANNSPEAQERLKGALALGTANQLTNIIRDVAEDLDRDRIYLPLQELHAFNYTEAELWQGVRDDRWRALMQFQVQRTRDYYQQAEDRLDLLNRDSRRAVRIALKLYRSILDRVEEHDYDVFSGRLYVPQVQKIGCIVSSHFNVNLPLKVPNFWQSLLAS